MFFALKNNIIHICARGVRASIVSKCSSPARNFSSLFFCSPSFFTSSRDLIHHRAREEYKRRRRSSSPCCYDFYNTIYRGIMYSSLCVFFFAFLCFRFHYAVLEPRSRRALCSHYLAQSSSLTVTCWPPRLKFIFISFTAMRCCCSEEFSRENKQIFPTFSAPLSTL